MLDVARRQAAEEGLTNVVFEQADAQIYPFKRKSFDVVLSRTTAMFFGDKRAAFHNIGAALRAGGQLVMTTWQPLSENEWIREFSTTMAAGRELPQPPPDAAGPFSLADPEQISALLSDAGFTAVTIDGTVAPMWFGANIDDAFDFVYGLLAWMLADLNDDQSSEARDALRASIAAHATNNGVLYRSAAWTTRAVRH
jgi:SAM-dependent methyltransferase